MKISDSQRLVSAKYAGSGVEISVYDDGFGPLWISRNSIGINGIVRAKTWEDAYGICEDEFFPEADETIETLVKEYGFKRESKKVVRDSSVLVAGEHTGVGERFERYPEDYPNGKLLPAFIRWVTVETPDPDAWTENELFQEAYGFRPNGCNSRDTLNHGIYDKDLNGDSLDRLTDEMLSDLRIELVIESDEDQDEDQETAEDVISRLYALVNGDSTANPVAVCAGSMILRRAEEFLKTGTLRDPGKTTRDEDEEPKTADDTGGDSV